MIPRARQLPPAIAALLDAAATKYHVPASLVRAVAWVESRGDPSAHSNKGARGIMQLMPSTAEDLGVTDSFDPAQNIDGGVRYIARLLGKYRGNEDIALMAYNWGPGNVDQHLEKHGSDMFPAQVQQYARNVLARKVEEGGREAATPFFGCSQLVLRCPFCSHELNVEVDVGLRR